jgi:hypothetical protein
MYNTVALWAEYLLDIDVPICGSEGRARAAGASPSAVVRLDAVCAGVSLAGVSSLMFLHVDLETSPVQYAIICPWTECTVPESDEDAQYGRLRWIIARRL